MLDWALGLPWGVAVAVLFVVVLARAQLTYWIGRGLVRGVQSTRWAPHLDRARVVRAAQLINRYGPPVVTVSFLTIGFQTAANGAAGLTRMPFPRYSIAMVLGCLAWAVLYASVGLAVLNAAVQSPWALAVLLLAVAAVVMILLIRHRRAGRATSADGAPTDTTGELFRQ